MKKFVMENWFFLPSLSIVALVSLVGILLLPLVIIYFICIYWFIIKPKQKNNNIKVSSFIVEWIRLLFWLFAVIVSIPFIWLFDKLKKEEKDL